MVVSGGAVSPENRSNEETLARRCAAAEDRARARCVKRAEVRLDASEIRSLLARLAAVERERDELRAEHERAIEEQQ